MSDPSSEPGSLRIWLRIKCKQFGGNLKAHPSNLLDSLSNQDITFFIPPYQRNYEWSEATCQVFFNDVKRVAKANATPGQYAEHFFGSIVYVIEEAGFGVPDKYILTDGQQRITSTMLLLMALRDSLASEDLRESIQRRYLVNERTKEDSEFKIKLKQVETDWEAYKVLALGLEVSEKLKYSSVYQNYNFFRKQISRLEEEDAISLLEKGLSKFSIIAITLEPDRNRWENPQEIFESMNSLGKPLSLADLARNFLLMGMTADQQTNLYKKYWLTLERKLPGKLSEFLRDWMQANDHKSFKVAKENNFKELYGQFRDVAKGGDVEDVLKKLVEFSSPYAIVTGLEQARESKIDQLISDLRQIGVSPAYSYLAELVSAWQRGTLPTKSLQVLLECLRTYILRRRIIGASLAENKFFPVLGARISAFSESTDLKVEFFSQLSSQEYSLRLPNDDEVAVRLEAMNFYNFGASRTYPRMILSLAEEELTKSRPNWDDPNLQIEHIMPQTIGQTWKAELGEDAEEIHRKAVNQIGNLTLIRHNQELGNKPFSDKKKIYEDNSGLQITKTWIVDTDVWNADQIKRRSDSLIKFLIEDVLKVPSSFGHSSNWRQAKDGEVGFDSKEIMNQLIGQEIAFIADPRVTARVLSDSKVYFEGSEWSLGPLTKEIKQRTGSVSDLSNFHGASNWTWDSTRLSELDLY